ncbi:MAG: hypothetical protein AB1750_14135 [Chloroflexota bacterium]
MRTSLLALLCLLLLASCGSPTTPPAPATPTPTPSVRGPNSGLDPCYYTWAYEPLPEISAEFQDALQAVIPNAEGRAQAYGEKCVKKDHTSTFSAMETDFNVTLPVPDLTDDEAIGQLVEQVLEVADQFAPPRVPGPNDGIVTFFVTSGPDNRIFRVTIPRGRELREQGLHGAALLQAIEADR